MKAFNLRSVVFILVISLFFVSLSSGCLLAGLSQRPEIVERRHISNFTEHKDNIYFGAGYSLYCLDPSSKMIDEVYKTDHLLVEQPLLDGTAVFFGGPSYTDALGIYGERPGFLAIDLESRKKLWKFDLGVEGYGTFGTYPIFAGTNVLVCARQRLHSLDKKTGKENWKIDNWFGRDGDGITIPYVFADSVFFKIAEEYFTKNDANDGQWAKVNLENGMREDVFDVVDHPGTYHDQDGNAIGLNSDGVVYGLLRYNGASWPSSFFGALDLRLGKVLWEIPVGAVRTKPVIAADTVFTFDERSVVAFDRHNGTLKWSQPLENIVRVDLDRSTQRGEWDYEFHYSRRLASDGRLLIVQGSRGIEARDTESGNLIWRNEIVSQEGDSDPIILKDVVIASSAKDCSLVGFDLTSGKFKWKLNIPNCSYHTPLGD
jgi:outer membrane protein assembly factor BamB